MTRTAAHALLSHWVHRPVQFITLVLGLALATALWSAVQAINAEARASYASAANLLENAARPVIQRPSGPITLEEYVTLRRSGWPVTPLLEGRLPTPNGRVQILGVDLLSWPDVVILGDAPDVAPEDLLTPPGRLIARPALAKRLEAIPDLPTVIALDTAPAGLVLADIGLVERLLNRTGQIDRLELIDSLPQTDLQTALPGATLTYPETPDTARLTDSFHLNLTAFGLLAFAVGLFVIHGVSGLAFEERRGTFRTLRALGLPLPVLTHLILAELVVLALIAGLLGIALGYVLATALLPDVSASLRGLYGAQVDATLTLRWPWVLGGMGMALLGALTAGAQGLLRLRRVPLLAATGPDRWASAAARQFSIMALGGALLAISGLAALGFGGLIAGFAAISGLLLGAALALPALLRLILTRIARRARGPVSQWVWSDMSAQLPGLSLALMALLLALATNIGVGTMVSSFRLTFTGWLDQRLAAEVYLRARSDEQAEEIAAWLTPRTDAVLPIRFVDTQLNGRPGRVYGIIDHATYHDNWPLIAAGETPWQALQNGAILVNEQLARQVGLWVGDPVALSPGWQAEIAGIYSDYGNPHPQAIVGMSTLLHHHPNIPNRQMGLRLDRADVPTLVTDLRATFDLPVDAVTDQRQIKAASLQVFERTFLVTGALNVLTLGVAGFAILTSLLTLWSARLPQLAPVWAMGLSRRDLARLEVLRSCGLAALTALVALPLGLALAWLLLAVVNVEAFGWRLPMFLFPLDWLRLMALALLAGALAALIPARRLTRLAPATLLKVFSHDR
ncbi:MAG: FtsX-like permease family protein [Paracoccaceae bacterium]